MKTCNCCGKSLPVGAFKLLKGQYRLGKCTQCVNKHVREKNAAKKLPPVVRPVRHSWESLGLECRPVWR